MPYRIKNIIVNKSVKIENGVYYLSLPSEKDDLTARIYLNVRKKEGRIYDDTAVKLLPCVNSSHKYFNEWKIRKSTSEKFCKYLWEDKSLKMILEFGCGNGWLSAKIAKDVNSLVYGLDINIPELEQGARVFKNYNNLFFLYGDIFNEVLAYLRFDYIVLASSLAYFEDAELLLNRLLTLLNDKGEIHFIDNPVYNADEIEAATQRSTEYYEKLGFPEMKKHYFHHNMFEVLKKYDFEVLHNPNSFINKINRKFNESSSPFYWIKVVKKL